MSAFADVSFQEDRIGGAVPRPRPPSASIGSLRIAARARPAVQMIETIAVLSLIVVGMAILRRPISLLLKISNRRGRR